MLKKRSRKTYANSLKKHRTGENHEHQDTDSDQDHLGYHETGRDAPHKDGHEPVYPISAGASQPDTHCFNRNRGLTRFFILRSDDRPGPAMQ